MVVELTQILLERTSKTFLPGDTIRGRVVVAVGGHKRHKFTSICLKVRGLAKASWTNTEGWSSSDSDETLTYSQQLFLVRDAVHFVQGPSAALDPGRHEFPFEVKLPTNLPPSFKSQLGFISYQLKARAVSDGLFQSNGRNECDFQVLPHLDLRNRPELTNPYVVEAEANQSMFGHPIGRYRLRLERRGFCGGDRIHISLDGPQRLFEKQAKSDGVVKLKKVVSYRAQGASKEQKCTLSLVHPERTETGWHQIELTVPSAELTVDETMCSIITTNYYIKIDSRHIDVHMPLVIGTVAPASAPPPLLPPSVAKCRPPPHSKAEGFFLSPLPEFGHLPAAPAQPWEQGGAAAPPLETPPPQFEHLPAAPAQPWEQGGAAAPPLENPPPTYEQALGQQKPESQ